MLRSSVHYKSRQQHDKANILADNWEHILNGEMSDQTEIEEYIARHKPTWKHEDLRDLDAEVSDDEVTAAIRKCKRDKACGPDDLNNEWYLGHIESLVPILTRVFNDCFET